MSGHPRDHLPEQGPGQCQAPVWPPSPPAVIGTHVLTLAAASLCVFPQSSASKFMCMYLAGWSLTRLRTVEYLGLVSELQRTHRRAPTFPSSTPSGQSRWAWPLLGRLLAAPSASLKSPPGRTAQDVVSPVRGCTLLNPWFAQCLLHRAWGKGLPPRGAQGPCRADGGDHGGWEVTVWMTVLHLLHFKNCYLNWNHH